MSIRAMKAGAVEFLTKPVRYQDLLDAIQLASRRTPPAATTNGAELVIPPRCWDTLHDSIKGRAARV